MRAIAINPYTKTIEEVEVDPNDIGTIYSKMSWLDHKVETVEIGHNMPNGDHLLVDMYGLFRSGRSVFKFAGKNIVGVGLLVGSSGSAWTDPIFTLTQMQDAVRWTNLITEMPE